MTDVTAISAALSSFKALVDIARSMIDLRDAQAFQSKVLEFNGQLIDAQQKILSVQDECATLTEHVRTLEKELLSLKDWDVQKQRYELKQITAGSFAYSLKQAEQGGEPSHYICANCYQNGKKSILQMEGSSTAHAVLGKSATWNCPDCKSRFLA